jgi:hypothetical protein
VKENFMYKIVFSAYHTDVEELHWTVEIWVSDGTDDENPCLMLYYSLSDISKERSDFILRIKQSDSQLGVTDTRL